MATETIENKANATSDATSPERAASQSATSEFVITRVLHAPRQLVWQAWSEAERMAQWWGPKGASAHVTVLEFRPGGIFHYSVSMPDGTKLWGKFVYQEITPPERLVFVYSFSDPDGGTTRSPFSAAFPLEIKSILTLEESDGKTILTLRSYPLNATAHEHAAYREMHASMQQGYGGTFDNLSDYLTTASL